MPLLVDPPMLCPARLIASLRLEPAGVGVRAGREVVQARGLLRHKPPSAPAVMFELEFDAEHGTMLRYAAIEDGVCRLLTQVLEITYDVPIGPEQFSQAPVGADGSGEL